MWVQYTHTRSASHLYARHRVRKPSHANTFKCCWVVSKTSPLLLLLSDPCLESVSVLTALVHRPNTTLSAPFINKIWHDDHVISSRCIVVYFVVPPQKTKKKNTFCVKTRVCTHHTHIHMYICTHTCMHTGCLSMLEAASSTRLTTTLIRLRVEVNAISCRI